MKKMIIIVIFVLGLTNIGYGSEVVLMTGYQDDSAPRYFKQGDMNRGINIDILDALNHKLKSKQIKILGDGVYPLPRIMAMMEKNTFQMFIGLTHNPKRDEKFLFGEVPIYDLQMVFAKNADDAFEYRGNESLKGKRVGTMIGTASSQQMKDIQWVLVEEVTRMDQNLLKLKNKRIDLVYYHSLGLLWEIKEGGFNRKIVFMKNAFETKSHYIMFTKSVPPFVIDEIDKALAELHAEGKIKKILAAYQ